MKRSIMILACAVLLARPTVGRAAGLDLSPSTQRPSGCGEVSNPAATGKDLSLKSPGAAARLSLAGTIVPFWGGILIGKNEGAGGG